LPLPPSPVTQRTATGRGSSSHDPEPRQVLRPPEQRDRRPRLGVEEVEVALDLVRPEVAAE
jgi:hypothetical protein